MARDWSEFEVEAVVSDYFAMLLKELRGEQYSKTAHRRALAKLLDDRSDGSVEFKHANISAVLIEFGYPYIAGYKPRWNYQQLLADAVGARLQVDRRLDRAARKAVDAKAEPVAGGDILSRWEPPPDVTDREASGSDQVPEYRLHPRPSVNYLEREARNRSLGLMGEQFVLAFEQARLLEAGRERLARQVEHVSVTQGDGLGFDIRSFECEGAERLIEVKTTGFGRQTPFFVSRNELRVSQAQDAAYHLCRVFAYRADPRLFVLDGALDRVCALSPTQYLARIG